MGWLIAARFASIGEAQAACSALDAARIDCYIADEHLIAIDWRYANSLGMAKVMVRAEDFESATEVLAIVASSEADPEPPKLHDEVPQLDPLRCPECASDEAVRRLPRLRMFLFFGVAAIGAGIAVGQPMPALTATAVVALIAALAPSHRCSECGARWTPAWPSSDVDAPPPNPSDLREPRCPRCGAAEMYDVHHRRLEAISLLLWPAIFVVLPMVWLAPKRRCDACGAPK